MDKPLHVQVAEALGCLPQYVGWGWVCGCASSANGDPWPHGSDEWGEGGGDERCSHIARYDTDWSVTGPLIDRLAAEGWIFVLQRDNGTDWFAHLSDIGHLKPHVQGHGRGPTAPTAVCNLILALKAADKLSAHGPVLIDQP